jgi:hypothetical protein
MSYELAKNRFWLTIVFFMYCTLLPKTIYAMQSDVCETTPLAHVNCDTGILPSYKYVAQQLGITNVDEEKNIASRCGSWMSKHLPVCTIIGGVSFWALWLVEALDGDNSATIACIIFMAVVDTGLGIAGYYSNEDRMRSRLLRKFLCNWDTHKSRTPADLHPLIEYIKDHQQNDNSFISPDNEFVRKLLLLVGDNFVDVELGLKYEEVV